MRAMQTARDPFSYRPYWANRFGTAPFLPMSRDEMDALGPGTPRFTRVGLDQPP